MDYVPDPGTVGADQIDFEICNQCNFCDQNTVVLDILNIAPVINPPPLSMVFGGGSLTIPILDSISDPNDNLDLSSFTVINITSGANAFFDPNGNLVVDYSGISFSGTDLITIEVCDLLG